MNRDKQPAPDGAEVSKVHVRHRELEQEVLQKGITASILDDIDVLAGQRPLGTAALGLLERGSDGKTKDEKHRDDLLHQSQRVREHLQEMDRIINALREQAQKCRDEASKRQENLDEHCELMEKGKDLLDNHENGKGDPQTAENYLRERGVTIPAGADEATIFLLLAEQIRHDQMHASREQAEIDSLLERARELDERANEVEAEKQRVDKELEAGVDAEVVIENSEVSVAAVQQKIDELAREGDADMVKEADMVNKEASKKAANVAESSLTLNQGW